MKYKLRPEQQEVVNFALNNPFCGLTLPTAFGKTFVAYDLANSFEGRTIIITLSNALVRQFTETFKIPYLIGKKHYRKSDYEAMKVEVSNSKIVLCNPASFHQHKKGLLEGFDNIIMDEADACLGLFKLQVGYSYGTYHKEMCTKQVYDMLLQVDEQRAENFIVNQSKRFWKVSETLPSDKKTHREPYTVTIHDVLFGGKYYFAPYKRVVLMSGTLFPSDVKELLGQEIPILEAPSPIPIKNRMIYGFTDDGQAYAPDNPEDQAKLIRVALETHKERPALAHSTYRLAPLIAPYLADLDDISFFTDKEEKIEALLSLEGSNKLLLGAGCQIGLDLKGDKCRLNILLNGFFPNVVDSYVSKRKSIVGGSEWYAEQCLRLVIQACGRSTRGVEDWSKVFICDRRIINLINRNKDKVPKYFIEACQFIETGTEVAT